jgi:hypothetical protein
MSARAISSVVDNGRRGLVTGVVLVIGLQRVVWADRWAGLPQINAHHHVADPEDGFHPCNLP